MFVATSESLQSLFSEFGCRFHPHRLFFFWVLSAGDEERAAAEAQAQKEAKMAMEAAAAAAAAAAKEAKEAETARSSHSWMPTHC